MLEQVQELLQGVPAFIAYFAASVFSLFAFSVVYLRVTPIPELALIKSGKTAPAISFGGAMLGYVLPVASVVANSLSLLDVLLWALVAMVVQIAAFVVIATSFSGIVKRIENDQIGSAVFAASISVSVGILNAACMIW